MDVDLSMALASADVVPSSLKCMLFGLEVLKYCNVLIPLLKIVYLCYLCIVDYLS